MPQLQSQYLTTVIVSGIGNLGAFATFSGGNVTSEAVPDRSPGQEYATQAGGEKVIEAINVSRRVELNRDTAGLEDALSKKVGITNAVTVGRKPLDANGAPFGKGRTYIGTLTAVNPTESDVNSQGEPSMLELIVAPSSVS